ncbi:cysteine hydrolase [Alicyclobacillus cycloheptanicus]|uniref:Nicotinamidase-related amidase n=1 Tax=Alicyclobacillus cycloheptanicus TaxID=1457 RepID=A0ABT9XHK0_9BACL|nr:cysteine hydrolase [Alicyclobacillus cycloheptanicus]MDQ0189763.1 nicotinamidase-related amidase [Alicyclobacillus cycloheptanicus]WDM01967.1 cysteine hydrolase [Alicyclobacillus cycloheptanicus]
MAQHQRQAGAAVSPWLVVVDMQHIFGDPDSPWCAPRFTEVIAPIQSLIAVAAPRVCFTRFVAPAKPEGAWIPYYEQWPFALQPPDSRDYQLIEPFAGVDGLRIDATTFGKWTPELAQAIPAGSRMLLAGVSTDCCVLSTALAAADAGVFVQVVADACAGVDDAAHERALAALRLYQPLIEVVCVDDVLQRYAEAGV